MNEEQQERQNNEVAEADALDPRTNELVDAVVERLLERLSSRPPIDPRDAVWDAKCCATYLGVSYTHFRNRVAPCPSFPKPFRLPSSAAGDGIGARRWIAGDVIKWARSGGAE